MKKKILLLAPLAIYVYFKFIKGILMRNNQQYQCYGFMNEAELIATIIYVACLLPLGANRANLINNLYEIAITESNKGTSLYKSDRGFGYGVWQFDPVAWRDLRARFNNNPSISNEILLKFQFDPRNTTYDQLKTDIVKACVYARMYLYWRIPSAIGATVAERGQQWATYYNTPAGASKGKPDLYIKRVNNFKNDLLFKITSLIGGSL